MAGTRGWQAAPAAGASRHSEPERAGPEQAPPLHCTRRRIGAQCLSPVHRCHRVRSFIARLLVVVAAVLAGTAHGMTREQALQALEHPDPGARLAAIEQLAEVGRTADADRLLPRLTDAEPQIRSAASDAIWQLWSRSGDPAIDQLFERGVEQMAGGAYDRALAAFNDIVARKPEFAEGWNKRATVYFLMGQDEASLKDCDEVFKRNPNHWGALSGAGQIHLRLGHLQQAIDYFERALKVNPTLDNLRQAIPLIEQRLRDKQRRST